MARAKAAAVSSPVDTSAETGAGVSTAGNEQENVAADPVQADLVAEEVQQADVPAEPVEEQPAADVAEVSAGTVLLITNNAPSDLTLGRKFLPAHQEVEVTFSNEREFEAMMQQAKAVGDLNGWVDVLTVKEKA